MQAAGRFDYPCVLERVLEPAATARLAGLAERLVREKLTGTPPDKVTRWWVRFDEVRQRYGDAAERQLVGDVAASRMMRIAFDALGPEVHILTHYCQFREYDPGRDVLPAQWHFDAGLVTPTTPLLTFWVALSDIGPDVPGLTLVDGPRRPTAVWERFAAGFEPPDALTPPGVRRKGGLTNAEIDDAIRDDPETTTITPLIAAGSAILFDGSVLHRTSVARSPHRRLSLEIRFVAGGGLPRGSAAVMGPIPLARLEPDGRTIRVLPDSPGCP